VRVKSLQQIPITVPPETDKAELRSGANMLELNAPPQVCCVVLNWNGWADTLECLSALKECRYPSLTIIVVDNGSTDDSAARIKSAHPDILVLESGSNLGFSGGNNIGIRHALATGANYVWLLNNDTKPASDAELEQSPPSATMQTNL